MWLIDLLFGHKRNHKSHRRSERLHNSHRYAEKPKRIKVVYNVYTYDERARDQLNGKGTDAVFSNVHKARAYAEKKGNKCHCPMLVVGVDSKGYDFDDSYTPHSCGRYGIISARLYDDGKWRVVTI